MKRAHRRTHFAVWLVLLPILAAALIWGAGVKTKPPAEGELPGVEEEEVFP